MPFWRHPLWIYLQTLTARGFHIQLPSRRFRRRHTVYLTRRPMFDTFTYTDSFQYSFWNWDAFQYAFSDINADWNRDSIEY